jgi:hypothetical protein
MLSSFTNRVAALESEGVYIGGWGLDNLIRPRKDTSGEYSESRWHVTLTSKTLANCSSHVGGSH